MQPPTPNPTSKRERLRSSHHVYDFRFPIYYLAALAWYREDADGFTFSVRVVPRASRNEIVGLHDGALKVRIAAPPVEGAANDQLIKFLAKRLGVPRSAVTLVSGTSSRNKTVRVVKTSATALEQLIKLS